MAGAPVVIFVLEMALQMEVTQYSSKREGAFVFDTLDCNSLPWAAYLQCLLGDYICFLFLL